MIILDIETTGLSAATNQIIIIGILKNDKIKQLVAKTEKEEKKILKKFDNIVANSVGPLVGFNIKRFDIPFIIARCLKHGVELSGSGLRFFLSKDRYCYEVIDLKDLCIDYLKFQRGEFGLDHICKVFGIEKSEINIEELLPRVLKDNNAFNKVKEKNKEDLKATKTLYEKFEKVLGDLREIYLRERTFS